MLKDNKEIEELAKTEGLNIKFMDFQEIMDTIIPNFEVKDEACYKGSYFKGFTDRGWEGHTNPAFCDNYAFFDYVHPTTKAHEFLFKEVKTEIESFISTFFGL